MPKLEQKRIISISATIQKEHTESAKHAIAIVFTTVPSLKEQAITLHPRDENYTAFHHWSQCKQHHSLWLARSE